MICCRVLFLCLVYGAFFVPYSAGVHAAPYEVGVEVNTTTFARQPSLNYAPELYNSAHSHYHHSPTPYRLPAPILSQGLQLPPVRLLQRA